MVQTKNSTGNISVINPVATENMGNKQTNTTQGSHIMLSPRIDTCVVSEKNWNTKEGKGKFMMSVLYVL